MEGLSQKRPPGKLGEREVVGCCGGCDFVDFLVSLLCCLKMKSNLELCLCIFVLCNLEGSESEEAGRVVWGNCEKERLRVVAVVVIFYITFVCVGGWKEGVCYFYNDGLIYRIDRMGN